MKLKHPHFNDRSDKRVNVKQIKNLNGKYNAIQNMYFLISSTFMLSHVRDIVNPFLNIYYFETT